VFGDSVAAITVISLAAFMIGLSKGGLGDGLGPATIVLVAFAMPIATALGVLLPLLIVGDAMALWALRGRWDTALVRILLPGAIVGVVGASAFVGSVPPRVLEVALGVFCVVFAGYRIAIGQNPYVRSQPDRRLGYVAGLAGGITSTIAHAGGPPVAAYLIACRTPPTTYAATMAAVFCAVNWLKVPAYAAAGLFDVHLLAQFAPAALLIAPGVLAGRWLVARSDPRVYERFLLAFLLLAACWLLLP